jgi:ribosome-associated toxin RatA of RatAB toxin-antitoxin module
MRPRVWRRTTIAAGVLPILALFVASVSAAPEWEKVSDKGGVLVERRPVPGSSIYEVRATARSPLLPAAIFETLWKHREYPEFVPHLKRLDLLMEDDDEHVTYEQVTVPLVTDRDYVVRLRKHVDAGAQRYEIQFNSTNDAGPPPDRQHVRVQRIQGSWLVVPSLDGKGSIIRYDVLTEPGGAIPAWITNRAQKEAVAALVHAVLKRAQENVGPELRSSSSR